MKILVTGSKGTIGQPLVRELLSQGHQVIGCDIVPSYGDDYIQSDITKPYELEKLFADTKPDVVFHLAALYGRLANERYAGLAIDTNITGTNNVIQLCKRYGSKLIFTSSSEVYGGLVGVLHEGRPDLNPNNRYGISKLMCEQLIQYEIKEHGLNAVILRPNMTYSENEPLGDYRSALIRFCDNLTDKKKITVYRDSHRSWIYMDDAVKIISATMEAPSGSVINIGHDEQVLTYDLAVHLCRYLKIRPGDYIIQEDTPPRMTQDKFIDITRMKEITEITPKVDIWDGSLRVMDAVIKKKRDAN